MNQNTMKIYFAGPLFSKAEKDFNQFLCEKIESLGFEVFLPQRDGVEKDKAPYNELPDDKRRVLIFNTDKTKIYESDIFLFVLDGRVPDEGACVELGLAYAHRELAKNKRILVGLHTDIRSAFISSKLNPIIKVPLDYIFSSIEELTEFLSSKIV